MASIDQKLPIIRPAASEDSIALSMLARQLLLYEKSFNEKMGVIAPWAANAIEIRKQMKRPNTQFFVAERDQEIIGYIKVVVHGRRLSRKEIGLMRWAVDVAENAARRLVNFVLRRPRSSVEAAGGYIAGIFVEAEERRSKTGSLLVEAAEKWLSAQGINHCELHVLFSNEIAKSFWENSGYESLTLGMRKKL